LFATVFGALVDAPSFVANRGEVSENSRIIATVSIAADRPAEPASSIARRAAWAIRS